MNRKLKTKIPEVLKKKSDRKLKKRDRQMKEKAKVYADKYRKARDSEIEVGDKVLLRQQHDKLSTNFNPEPCSVIDKVGNAVTVQKGEQIMRRNSSHMKKFNESQDVTNNHLPEQDSQGEVTPPPESNVHDQSSQSVTPRRSSRTSVPPRKLNDYELY